MAGFCIAVTILLLVARHVQDTHFLFLSTRETRQSAATLSFADVTTTASNTGAGQEQGNQRHLATSKTLHRIQLQIICQW